MNRQAVVGLFTIVALVALFAVFFVLANIGTRGRYPIGVHFKSAAGLHKGALVYESGVVVGTVQSTRLLPDDFSVEVVLAIDNSVDIPRDARFLIQAPLTGDSTVEIVPPLRSAGPQNYVGQTPAPNAIAVLPHEVLPLDQQPKGENPATIQDLLAQGQGQLQRLDQMLAELQAREPRLLNTLQNALDNANAMTLTMRRSLGNLSDRLDVMGATLQTALQSGGSNLVDITNQVDQTVRANRGHINAIIASLDGSARALNDTADSVRTLARDPRLHDNLIRTTKGIADTATTVATLAGDLRNVTGNPQTQAQLRDTIANADAAMQKANSILGSFGGRSSVYGVDAGATPAPKGTFAPATGPTPSPAASGAAQNIGSRLSGLAHNLVELQVRISELSAPAAGAGRNSSPILSGERGPQSDVGAIFIPHGSLALKAGANDIGTSHTTYNGELLRPYGPRWQIGGGVLYSRLGASARYQPNPQNQGFGFDGRIYDLRRPTADAYLDFGLGHGFELFGGERDLLHDGRRAVFGMQYAF